MVNYAHRGASEYAPENTLAAFYLGLMQGANGIETDVQKTRDGVLVLFHDDTLERVSDGCGRLCDHTLEQLQGIKIHGRRTDGFFGRIVTLREFLEKFSCYDICFAIELKGAGVEADTLAMVEEFKILDRVTFTSFEFEYIKQIELLNPNSRVGWLVREVTQETLQHLSDIGGEEAAPMAENITQELVDELRRKGFGIRAWGVFDTALMEKMCTLGVDGMTVNFPDKLSEHLGY